MQPYPEKLLRQRYRQLWYFPLAMSFPMVISSFVFLGMQLAGRNDDWTTAFFGMLLLSATGWLLGGLMMGVVWFYETWQIRRTIDRALVVWPQTIQAAHWQDLIHQNHQRLRSTLKFPRWSIVMVVVILAGVFLYTMTMISDPAEQVMISVVFVGLMVIFPGIVAANYWQQHWQLAQSLRYQQQWDNPRVFISKRGLYHEALGFQEIGSLAQVELIKQHAPPQAGLMMPVTYYLPADPAALQQGWLLLRFYVRRQAGRYTTMPAVIDVMVPPDRVNEAQGLIRQFLEY